MVEFIAKWSSKGITISQSSQHKGMFIMDDGSGGFWNIHSSQELMMEKYPPGARRTIVKKLVRPSYGAFDNDVPVYGVARRRHI